MEQVFLGGGGGHLPHRRGFWGATGEDLPHRGGGSGTLGGCVLWRGGLPHGGVFCPIEGMFGDPQEWICPMTGAFGGPGGDFPHKRGVCLTLGVPRRLKGGHWLHGKDIVGLNGVVQGGKGGTVCTMGVAWGEGRISAPWGAGFGVPEGIWGPCPDTGGSQWRHRGVWDWDGAGEGAC